MGDRTLNMQKTFRITNEQNNLTADIKFHFDVFTKCFFSIQQTLFFFINRVRTMFRKQLVPLAVSSELGLRNRHQRENKTILMLLSINNRKLTEMNFKPLCRQAMEIGLNLSSLMEQYSGKQRKNKSLGNLLLTSFHQTALLDLIVNSSKKDNLNLPKSKNLNEKSTVFT